MFHSAKALLFSLGFIEKRHIAIIAVLEEINKEGKLEIRYLNYFKSAMSARENADYHYAYSKDIAKYEVEICKEFIDKIKQLLNK